MRGEQQIMKIGILTFTGTSNFGASLQAYALQQVILAKGHTCEIIRYECPKVKNAHDPRRAFKSKGFKRFFAPAQYLTYKKRMNTFARFDESYCIFSEKCDSSSIRELSWKYDRIIVGSDQVWNPDITGDDLTFFLDFIDDPQKKCSYAASIGMNYFSGECKKYEELIKKFNIISVREQSTANCLQEKINRQDISCDADPTILLCNKWAEFVHAAKETDDYIFLYFTPNDATFIKTVKRFAVKNNYKIILLTKGLRKHIGIKSISNISPIDFINYIAHAKYVITGSFHALCFSIMLKKEFYVTDAPIKERSGRLTQFLSNLGLEDRMLSAEKPDIEPKGYDHEAVYNKIDQLREKSLITIDRILNE